jgi:hypothetical protein
MLASTTPFDDGPQVIVWRNAWPFVDLCPTEPFARKVVAAMTRFQSEIDSPRAPEIEAFALEKLASLKSAVIPVLKETLPKTTNKLQRKIFESALARAEAS